MPDACYVFTWLMIVLANVSRSEVGGNFLVLDLHKTCDFAAAEQARDVAGARPDFKVCLDADRHGGHGCLPRFALNCVGSTS